MQQALAKRRAAYAKVTRKRMRCGGGHRVHHALPFLRIFCFVSLSFLSKVLLYLPQLPPPLLPRFLYQHL